MAERAHPEDSGFQEGSIYRENFFKRYKFANEYTQDRDILDIPCGTGWGTSLINAKTRTGIDISREAIKYAVNHYAEINFLVGSMDDIPLADNSIDVVVCLEGYEHVSKEIGIDFLAETSRILRKEGLIVLSCPVIFPGGEHSGNPYHLYEPTVEEFGVIIGNRFKIRKTMIHPCPDNPILYFVGILSN
jgi:ubiquinone/menaquinone biosynthesis C-methylase UbiE